ncbi:MAG TPA: DMT family transporter [Candidatus Limnocylindrales bacterium]|nr:DMT family transporter [Candidatus Limnocylindrales bacterium]
MTDLDPAGADPSAALPADPAGRRSATTPQRLDAVLEHPQAAAVAGALCIAFSGIFVRWSGVSPSTAAVFRCLYALPLLGILGWLEGRRYGPLDRRTICFSLVAGVFFAADLTFWAHSIEAVGAGLATVLGNLQVVVVGIAAWALYGERPRRSILVALPIVIAGVVLIAGIVGAHPYGSDPLLGVAAGLVTAFAYAGYLIVVRRGQRDIRRLAGPLVWATLATAVASAVAGVVVGDFDPIPTFPAHLYLAVLALTAQVAGYLLINVSLPRLPSVVTSLLLLTQPVVTVFLAMILLGEAPSAFQLVGVGLVMAGLAVAVLPFERLRGSRVLTAN